MASAPVLTPPVSFNTAFERLREIASKDDVRSFNSTKLEDVWTTVKDIERHLESRRSLRGFHRIQPFLAGIEQYSKVVEVLCQGTPYLPYIWVIRSTIIICQVDPSLGTHQASTTGQRHAHSSKMALMLF